jgi:hypothetical protein
MIALQNENHWLGQREHREILSLQPFFNYPSVHHSIVF